MTDLQSTIRALHQNARQQTSVAFSTSFTDRERAEFSERGAGHRASSSKASTPNMNRTISRIFVRLGPFRLLP